MSGSTAEKSATSPEASPSAHQVAEKPAKKSKPTPAVSVTEQPVKDTNVTLEGASPLGQRSKSAPTQTTLPVVKLGVHKVDPAAVTPSYATKGSACFDVSVLLVTGTKLSGFTGDNAPTEMPIGSDNDGPKLVIPPNYRVKIPTGLRFHIPAGFSVRLHSRSGKAFKEGLVLCNGEAVIDADYFAETFILVRNTSNQKIVVRNQDKICQGEVVEFIPVEFELREDAPEQTTDRVGGIGSTGQ